MYQSIYQDFKQLTPAQRAQGRNMPDCQPCYLWTRRLVAFFTGAALVALHLSFSHPAQNVQHHGRMAVPLPQDFACNISELPSLGGPYPRGHPNFIPRSTSTLDRLIVVARDNEDTSWLDLYLGDIPHLIYQVDSHEALYGAQHRVRKNKGDSSMVYVQFIIDYYDRLPANVLFLKGARGTWHMHDHVPIIKRLRWGAFGYGNLRYTPGVRLDWLCGDRTTDWPYRELSCNWVGLKLRPRGVPPRKASSLSQKNRDEWKWSVELNSVWDQLFRDELGEPPRLLAAPCCGEFMVSRRMIRSHPLAFYIHLRNWMMQTELDRNLAGRVFEYMWHYIFGEPAVAAPKFECDLLTCTPEQQREADELRLDTAQELFMDHGGP